MFQLPELPYDYSALEPVIDEATMKLHHDKHHAGYTSKLNDAIDGTALENQTIEEILKNISRHPQAVRNNGGGFYNHRLFWQVMSPNGGGQPSGSLAKHLNKEFNSFDDFKAEFIQAATGQFGSGWAWLVVTNDGELEVTSTPNQDNPLMDLVEVNGTPILGIDVWEHAYYLHYQNRRAAYVEAWWDVVNWDVVQQQYDEQTT